MNIGLRQRRQDPKQGGMQGFAMARLTSCIHCVHWGKATTFDHYLVPVNVLWACWDEKVTHCDCPQALESDFPFSLANSCGYLFTPRPWTRQWIFYILRTFSSSDLEQDTPGFESKLCFFLAKWTWASQLTFLNSVSTTLKWDGNDSNLVMKK